MSGHLRFRKPHSLLLVFMFMSSFMLFSDLAPAGRAKGATKRNPYHFESSICPRITATARRTWDTILPKMFLRSSCRSPLGRTVCQRLQQRQQQKDELHQLSRALTTATGPRKHVSKVMLEEVAGLRSCHFEM